MLMMDVKKIRTLVHEDEVKKFAEAEGLPPGLVSQLKLEWNRKLSRKCVVCGDRIQSGIVCGHPRCKGTVLDPRPVGVLLMQLPQGQKLRSRSCSECGGEFVTTVGRELRAYRRGFIPDLCDNCRRKRLVKPLTYCPFGELADLRHNLPKKAKKKGGRNGRRERKHAGGDVHGSPA